MDILKDWSRFDGAAIWAQITTKKQAEIVATALEIAMARHGVDRYLLHEEKVEYHPFVAAAALREEWLAQAVDESIKAAVPALDDDRGPAPYGHVLCRFAANA